MLHIVYVFKLKFFQVYPTFLKGYFCHSTINCKKEVSKSKINKYIVFLVKQYSPAIN